MSDRNVANPVEGRPVHGLNGHAPAAPQAKPHDEHAVAANLPKFSAPAVTAMVVVIAVLFVGLFFLGWIPHTRRVASAASDATDRSTAKPVVEVLDPKMSAIDDQLLLPGDVRPNQMTAIFARTSGYMKPLPAGIDIGARVKEGQLIAEIAAPELDAQLDQAKASLEQARAAVTRVDQEYQLNASTLKRYESASLTHAVAQQDLDEKRSAHGVAASALKEAQANVIVAESSVKRLSELQEFEKVIAPFSGVITARNYDTGALISASDTAPGKEMFRIEQEDILRVSVNVPQGYATDIRVGQGAEVLVRNYPGRSFPGTVARSTGAIDQATRTLRVEVDVPNKEGQLLPGMYVNVRFQVHRDHATIVVPTSALIFGSEGVRVAVLDKDRVRFRPVTLGRDYGVEAEVVTGLTKGDQLVNNPGALEDGAEVSVRKH